MKLRWYDENGFEVALDYEDYRDLRKENRKLRKEIKLLENIIEEYQIKLENIDSDCRIRLIDSRDSLAKDINKIIKDLEERHCLYIVNKSIKKVIYEIDCLDKIIDDINENANI